MRVTIDAPATSANLGPGFDRFGLALEICNRVILDTEAEPAVTWEGEGADELPVDGSDLVARAMAAVAERMSLRLPEHARHGMNRIPLERGLGSSSAAAVAAVVGASALLDVGIHDDAASVFALAAEIEGHPDNAAAACFGGFTLALEDGFVRRLEPHPDLAPTVIVPDLRLGTPAAREALPAAVPLEDAVFNIGHAALAVEAFTRDPSLLGEALRDRIHQDARMALVDGLDDVVAELRSHHVPFCVSGAGPSLIAFEQPGREPVTAEILGLPAGWRLLRPAIRVAGYGFDVEG